MVLEGYRRCPDSHDLSEWHHLYDWAGIYRFNSVNFDSDKLSVEALWDHLKNRPTCTCGSKVKGEKLEVFLICIVLHPFFEHCYELAQHVQ